MSCRTLSVVRFALLTFVVLLAACGARTSDEQKLRSALAAMQQAVEARKPGEVVEHVAEDFTGADGDFDRRKLHDLLRLQVLRNERIGVTVVVRDIRIDVARATVVATVTLTGSSGSWIPARGAVYTITSGWRRDGSDWKAVHANWQRDI